MRPAAAPANPAAAPNIEELIGADPGKTDRTAGATFGGEHRMSFIKGFFAFLRDIIKDRRILWTLAKNDFKARFAASFLGGFWAFAQPLVTLLVLWFVFEVGFRNPPISNVPFIVWLTPAYLVWSFFSEALVAGANCIQEYSYLVKKVNFRVSMIPIGKIISSAFIHLGFIIFIFFLLIVYRIPLSIYNLQVFYYFLCAAFLLLGMCWMLSAITPFVKDVSSIVSIFIQIGFWMTPIFWLPDNMSPKVQTLLKINPMFYICRGYRDSFIDHVWFWQRGFTNWEFWFIAVLFFAFGAYLFKKLRPQFADVL